MTETHLNRDGRSAKPDALPAWKRGLDFACLFFAAPALVPVMAVIAIIIRFSSRGPILFRQERIGLRGEPFQLVKFRTMKQCAETDSHRTYLQRLIESNDAPMEKMDANDHRLIPMGGLLRASGLDELPQIFNILRGEMSLVGPRPCIRYEYERYKPEHRERLNAVPGLTGLWQVSGKNKTTFPEMVELDIRYSRNLSLLQDVAILIRTFPVVIEQTREAAERKRARQHPKPPVPAVRKPERNPLTSI